MDENRELERFQDPDQDRDSDGDEDRDRNLDPNRDRDLDNVEVAVTTDDDGHVIVQYRIDKKYLTPKMRLPIPRESTTWGVGVRFSPIWDKFVIFSDQISVDFG